MNLQKYPESHLGSSAQKRPIAFPLLLFTIKKEEVSILLLDWGPKGPTQGGPKGPAQWAPGRARKGPPAGPRAVSAPLSAIAGCIDSGHSNRRPQNISGVSGEPRNADRLGPEACQDRSGAFRTGPAAEKKVKKSGQAAPWAGNDTDFRCKPEPPVTRMS